MRVVRGGDMYLRNESEFSSLSAEEGVLISVAFSSSVRTNVPIDSRYMIFWCKIKYSARSLARRSSTQIEKGNPVLYSKYPSIST